MGKQLTIQNESMVSTAPRYRNMERDSGSAKLKMSAICTTKLRVLMAMLCACGSTARAYRKAEHLASLVKKLMSGFHRFAINAING